MLVVSEKGIGKRTMNDDFKLQNRGGKGVKCYKISEKTGKVCGIKAVNDDDEIMIITTEGIIIQTKVDSINARGRVTSGVKLINLDPDVMVAGLAKVKIKDEDGSEESENKTPDEPQQKEE